MICWLRHISYETIKIRLLLSTCEGCAHGGHAREQGPDEVEGQAPEATRHTRVGLDGLGSDGVVLVSTHANDHLQEMR